ncbi:MAG: AsmA family protein [Micavibrio sp.]
MTVGRELYGLPEPQLPPKPPSRWRWPARIILGLSVVMGVSLTSLSMLGGNGDSMKESLENYLGDLTGSTAKIETLNAVIFFPVLGVDFDGITLTRDGAVVARFSHVNFSTGFWGALSGRSALRSLDFSNGSIDAGVLTPRSIKIDQLKIDFENVDKPILALDGEYGGEKMTLRAALKRKIGVFGASSFELANDSRMTLRAGAIALESLSGTGKKGERTLLIETLTPGEGMAPIKGNLSISRRIKDVGFAGQLESGASRMDFDMALANDDGFWTMTGEADFEKLNLEDVFSPGGLVDGYGALRAFYFGDRLQDVESVPFDFSMLKVDIKTDVKALSKGDLTLGSVSTPLTVEDGILGFHPLLGEIKGGILSGSVLLDATKAPAQLSADVNIKGLDYTSLSTIVKAGAEDHGRADLKTTLTAQGNSGDALWNDLDGKMMVIAGQGELSSPLISLWGGGLLNAMLPSFGREDRLLLNCGIGDFEITDGIAQTKTFFLDTDGVTVVGDGTINFKESTIDLKLEPKSKDAAFFSAATAVHLEGKLEKPSIDPDVFSLGKKLGGLFLGTINPAFLAFSLTDFGFSEQHPCQPYLKP